MTTTFLLGPGSIGDPVRDLQRRLARMGLDVGGDRPGTYGPGTEAAVRAFQQLRGLRADGVCGAQTWSSLVEAAHALGDRMLYLRAPMLRGDDVAELQRLLGLLGFDAGKVDGIFGPRTAAAVTEFQRNAGLTTDGICGPDTVEAVRRFATRIGEDGPTSTVAALREVEGLRRAPRTVEGLRVAVADAGGTNALATAVARALADRGAVTTVLHDPDDAACAAAANAFEAAVFLALRVRPDPGAGCSYYAREGFASAGGRRLAHLITTGLDHAGVTAPAGLPAGMRLPLLRETRMPAVVVEVGPPTAVVASAPVLVETLATAVETWARSPVDVEP